MADPIIAYGADGSQHEFPPDTPDEAVDFAMKRYTINNVPRPVQSGPQYDSWWATSSTGRILDAFGMGAKHNWGTTAGKEDSTFSKQMKDWGVYNDYENHNTNVIKSINEAFMRPTSTALQTVFQGIPAIIGGLAQGVKQIGAETGAQTVTDPIAAIPEVLPAFIGTTFPAAGMTLRYLLGRPPLPVIPTLPGLLDEARGARVIGEGEAGWLGAAKPTEFTGPRQLELPLPGFRREGTTPGTEGVAEAGIEAPKTPPVIEPPTIPTEPLPRPSPLVNEKGQFLTERIETVEDVQRAVQDGINHEQTGTVATFGELQDLSAALGIHPADIMNFGTRGEVDSAMRLLIQSASEVKAAADAVPVGRVAVGTEEVAKFLDAKAKHDLIVEGLTAERGVISADIRDGLERRGFSPEEINKMSFEEANKALTERRVSPKQLEQEIADVTEQLAEARRAAGAAAETTEMINASLAVEALEDHLAALQRQQAAPARPLPTEHPYARVEIRANPGGGFDIETPLEGIQHVATMAEAQRLATRYTRLTGEQVTRYEAETGRNYGDDWRNNEVDTAAAQRAAAPPTAAAGGVPPVPPTGAGGAPPGGGGVTPPPPTPPAASGPPAGGPLPSPARPTAAQAAAAARAAAALRTPQQVARFAGDSFVFRFTYEAFVNSILSNIGTQLTYMVQQAIAPVLHSAEVLAASLVGAGMRGVGLAQGGIRLGEFPMSIYALRKGTQDGIVAAVDSARTGIPLNLTGQTTGTWLQQYGTRTISGPFGVLMNLPSRLTFTVPDAFFRTIGYTQGISEVAYRAAVDQGLSPLTQAFYQRVAFLERNPTVDMITEAREGANARALMGEGGALTRAVTRAMDVNVPLPFVGGRWLRIAAPFIHFGNVVWREAALERTPIGFLSPEIRANLSGRNGAAAQQSQIGRMAVTSSVILGLLTEFDNETLTGPGPQTPEGREQWRLQGKQPFSAKLGNSWYDYKALGPFAVQLGMIGTAFEAANHMNQQDYNKMWTTIFASVHEGLVSNTFMRGPADILNAIREPHRYAGQYIDNQLVSLTPGSAGLRWWAQQNDPYQREVYSIWDKVKTLIPFGEYSSQTLHPKIGWDGEPIPTRVGAGFPGSAIYTRTETNDPVIKALDRLGMTPALPKKDVRGVELTPQQYEDFSRLAGRFTKWALNGLVTQPGFENMNPGLQRKMITTQIDAMHEMAATLTQGQYPAVIMHSLFGKIGDLMSTSTKPPQHPFRQPESIPSRALGR